MGREIRRVPADWEHPKDDEGNFIPLYGNTFVEKMDEWIKGYQAWRCGKHECNRKNYTYVDWEGEAPISSSHRPEFHIAPSHYQVYETVSEGTPITPHFATKDELVEYLVENGDYWNTGKGWNRSAAERLVKDGWAPSMMIISSSERTKLFEPDQLTDKLLRRY